MGLIDSLKRFFSKEQENIIDYVLPGKYMNFPVYPGIIKGEPIEKTTENYDRLTIYYKGRPNKDFIYSIKDQGFIKATDVRYERDHTYIIVEEESFGTTKIAYHIKKY